jgi:hypothetical protein
MVVVVSYERATPAGDAPWTTGRATGFALRREEARGPRTF